MCNKEEKHKLPHYEMNIIFFGNQNQNTSWKTIQSLVREIDHERLREQKQVVMRPVLVRVGEGTQVAHLNDVI